MSRRGLTCKEASRLLSDAQDSDLPARDRAYLRLHLVICEACRNAQTQIGFLRQAMRRLGTDDDGPDAGDGPTR